jgi:quercetin dioxygenase-like cupin family protein
MIKALGLALMLAGTAQVANHPVPIDQEPDHHFVLDNEYTRVFSVEVPVGQQTLMHEHKNDYIFVCIGDADVSNMPEGRDPVRLQLEDGCASFVKAPLTHIAKNLADKPFRNVTIEILKQGEVEGSQTRLITTTTRDLSTRGLIDNSKVLANEITLQPDGVIRAHTHTRPHLVVALTELHLVSTPYSAPDLLPARSPAKRLDVPSGTVQWVPAGTTHSVANAGPREARFVTVEFK